MIRSLLIAALLSPLVVSARGAEVPPTLQDAAFLTSPGRGWKLLWHDEFAGDTLDAQKWTIGLPWRGTDGEGRHHNDQYASYIADHNVALGEGALRLLTRREDVRDARGRTFHFTQGLITTAKSFRHRYGYWEARVKLPAHAGPGLWPAFWTLAEGWPPEMDICEVWTSSNRSHQGLCYRAPEGGRERWDDIETRTPLPTGWTTYGMEWGPGYQVYNINRTITKRVFGDHVTGDEHYILLNSGVESANKPTAATVFPNAFEVDYVRVYQRPELALVHNGGFEHDSQRPWERSGQAVVIAYDARTGNHCLRVDGRSDDASAAEQKLFGLRAKAKYVLTAFAKRLSDAGEARLGVRLPGGDNVVASDAKSAYGKLQIEFITPADATTATIFCSVPANAAALFDDVEIHERQ